MAGSSWERITGNNEHPCPCMKPYFATSPRAFPGTVVSYFLTYTKTPTKVADAAVFIVFSRRSSIKRVLIYRIVLAIFILGYLLPDVLSAQSVGCNHYTSIRGISDSDMPKYWMGIGLVSMDVNKDGHLDLLASANGPNTVFVYFGGRGIFDTTADLTLKGSGEMVKGDFDGDGLTDLAVRIRFYYDGQRLTTRFDTFLVYMGVEDSLYAIETQPRHIIPGPRSSQRGDDYSNLEDHLFAADLDGNGKDELIMGGRNYRDTLRAQGHGAIFVWHYPRGDDSDTLSYIYSSDQFWYSWAAKSIGVEDVNGDGIADIQLAIREAESGSTGFTPLPPRIRVAFGRPGKYPDLSRPDQLFENDVMGYAKDTYVDRTQSFWTTLLDVNNDGLADMLWVPCRDSLWIMYGTPQGLSGKVDRIIANHDTARWSGFGWQHQKIGDYNGDGYNDFVLHLGAAGYPAMVVYGGNSYGLTNQPIAVCVAGGQYGGRYYVSLGDITGDGGEEICTSDPIPPGIQESWVLQPGYVAIIQSYIWIKTDADVREGGEDPDPSPFSVDIYPSPTTGDINIMLHGEEPGEYQLRLYSLEGRAILTRTYELIRSNNVLIVPAQEIPAAPTLAVYFIELTHAGNTVRRKVMVSGK